MRGAVCLQIQFEDSLESQAVISFELMERGNFAMRPRERRETRMTYRIFHTIR